MVGERKKKVDLSTERNKEEVCSARPQIWSNARAKTM